MLLTHVRGITHRASARRQDGDGFDARLKLRHIAKDIIIWYLLLICLMRSNNVLVSCTFRTIRQRACNQRVGSLQ